ncbi:MAG TPA: YqhA family protein [Anaerolineales bacterium]|nr:YqhA family protein [Anaerolineales bacterium]
MKTILEKSRYLALIGVVPLLVASIAAFVWGLLQTFQIVMLVISSLGTDEGITVGFIKIIDIFLIATATLIFTLSLYRLFIGEINAPQWMLAEDLYELKGKLSSMVVLVMAVKFLEYFMEVKDANELLRRGIAVTLVSAVLIAFGYFGKRNAY